MTSRTTAPFHFNAAQLTTRADAAARAYRHAEPFPHVVFDEFLPMDVADAAAAEFDAIEADLWDLYTDQGNTLKLATSNQELMGPVIRQLVAEMNGAAVIGFLELLTGIDGLVPDPHLLGGGLHQLNPGGFLRIHADFNRHPRLNLDRRINLLLYLNPEWQDDWGGALELWNADMSACGAKITPLLNRVVVFNTTSTAYHGNPDPVACPEGRSRRSLAFYYYTNGRPEQEQAEAHSTLYQTPGKVPASGAGGVHPTDRRGASRSRELIRDLLPPAALRAARRLRARRSS